MSTRANQKSIQDAGSSRYVFNEYERLEDAVLRKTGVACSIVVLQESVSVRTKNYADWLLAKVALRSLTHLPVVHDE